MGGFLSQCKDKAYLQRCSGKGLLFWVLKKEREREREKSQARIVIFVCVIAIIACLHQAKGKKPIFVQFVLENIWEVYKSVLIDR